MHTFQGNGTRRERFKEFGKLPMQVNKPLASRRVPGRRTDHTGLNHARAL
jgi:hypothetical protein